MINHSDPPAFDLRDE